MRITLFYLMDNQIVEYTPMIIKKTCIQNNTYYKINYTYEKSKVKRILVLILIQMVY